MQEVYFMVWKIKGELLEYNKPKKIIPYVLQYFTLLIFFLAQESDYDLNFASKSTANYAVYNEMPSLTELTACVWIRVTHQSVHYIFTYASSSSPDAIALGYYANYSSLTRLYFNINAWSFM